MNLEVESILPYNQDENKKTQIESMFDNIAHKYDFLNRFLSLGIDISWRKRAIREIGVVFPKRILDMATGTGDFAFEALVLNPEKVVGVDLSQNMLDIGIQKSIKRNQSDKIEFIKGDSEHLSYESNSFDAITVGFGVRNFQHLKLGLSELSRVLKPGGMIAILEPSFPTNPILKGLFTIHFKYVTPIFGKLFSKDARAYTYLPDSVEAFPQGVEFCKILTQQGFIDTKHIPLTFGMCALYTAKK
jgi:demethylmenaquinone methyltransferase / 2-methoxy-6-polyprenyl-1,4-benzoquinol methylase